MKEIWRDIKNFEGYYQASNWGRVKSLARLRHGGLYFTKERILKPALEGGGYYMVILYKDGKKYNKKIHRLVCTTFHENPLNLPDINHKDTNKLNNNEFNLEWCTEKQNTQHAIKMGVFDTVGENNGKHKLIEKEILEIRALKGIMTYRKIADKFNISEPMISNILNNKNWTQIK